jgi:hypothetical protein
MKLVQLLIKSFFGRSSPKSILSGGDSWGIPKYIWAGNIVDKGRLFSKQAENPHRGGNTEAERARSKVVYLVSGSGLATPAKVPAMQGWPNCNIIYFVHQIIQGYAEEFGIKFQIVTDLHRTPK